MLSKSPSTIPSLPAAFTATAKRYADRVAVIDAGARATYGEISERAARLETVLRARGIGPGSRVGLDATRSAETLVVMIGVLRSGACVVFLNPDYPDAMLRAIDEQAAPDLVIWRHDAPTWLPSVDVVTVADLLGTAAEPAPLRDVDPESCAFLLFTSGSTGVPKGVRIPHRGIARVQNATVPVLIGPDDRVLQSSPLSFAASTTELWFSLLHGAAVVLMPPGKPALGDIVDRVRNHDVTVLNLPCGLFALLVDTTLETLADVRTVLVSGDFVSVRAARALLAHSAVELFNGFGCTENSALTSAMQITMETLPGSDTEAVPIGTPLPGVELSVRDDRLRPVEPGTVGELCIAGAGLALDYLDQPDLTAEKFVTVKGTRLLRTGDLARMGEDGAIRLVGRTDDMVKIRGFRVELLEVQRTAAVALPVAEIIVKALADGDQTRELTAFYTTGSGRPLDVREARELLAAHLPDYMIPTRWCHLAALPLNANGKPDRGALDLSTLADADSATDSAGPSARTAPDHARAKLSPTDQVREAFANVVGRPIEPDESFWATGATSLHAIEMAARLQFAVGFDVRPEDVMEFDTPDALGARLADLLTDAGQPDQVG